MVFLFPGVLFRRAFFSGKFKKHFDSGNPLERVLWNILFSVLCIISFCIIIYFINVISPVKIEFELNNQEILDSFTCIYENKFPTALSSVENVNNSIKLLLSIYCFSVLIGYFFNKIIFYLGLEKRFTIFKFQDNWQYLTNSNKHNNSNHSVGDLHYTKVDIKTSNQELFTGKLHEISYDKEGKIDAITIQEAYKFYKCNVNEEQKKIEYIKEITNENDPHIIIHIDNDNDFVYRKRIKGNLFTVFNNEIENMSITYIKISDFYEKFQKISKKIFSIIFLIIVIISISYAIWDFQIIEFKNQLRRIIFCITFPFVFGLSAISITAILNVKLLKTDNKKYLNEVKDTIVILIIFLIPYLYIFSIIKTSYSILIFTGYFLLCGALISKKEKEKETEIEETLEQ